MDRREVNLKPDEVERALEEFSGILSSNNYDPINTRIFPELSPRPTSSPQPEPSNENVMQPPPPRSSRHGPSLIEHEKMINQQKT
ncbi:unnamed protein product [Parnassius apollo]|uniref:(apollo) hypothetical protein n=1 Tax=Parnassius apollo TaxID=110799 RepID=A0A8S3WFU0_PARAO|nr:unnamed protein product [Parnassius apollo]